MYGNIYNMSSKSRPLSLNSKLLPPPYRGLFEASEEVVVLHLEDVLLVVVRDGQPRSLRVRSHMTSAHRGRGVSPKADDSDCRLCDLDSDKGEGSTGIS